MKKLLPSFVAGFGAGVLQVVPLIKSFSCCLVIPAAAIIAIILEQKSRSDTGKIEMSRGLVLGVMTGIFAAAFGSFFEIFITLITKSNELVTSFNEFQNIINNFPLDNQIKQQVIDLFSNMVNDIKTNGFSLLYAVSIIGNNFVVNTIFGLIGGLIGTRIVNSRKNQIQ